MTLLLASIAFGFLPASRGSLVGILAFAWALAAVMSASILFGAVDLAGVLPAIGMALLGFNAGVLMGYSTNYALATASIRR